MPRICLSGARFCHRQRVSNRARNLPAQSTPPDLNRRAGHEYRVNPASAMVVVMMAAGLAAKFTFNRTGEPKGIQ